MLYVDVSFANRIGPRFPNFKRKSEYLWNFSCPLCGDSKKNKKKARAFFYRKQTGLFFVCHNCNEPVGNIGNFIKKLDPAMYREYVLETYKEGGAPHTPHKDPKIAVPAFLEQPAFSKCVEGDCVIDDVLDPLHVVDCLPDDHPAVEYCRSRKLPRRTWKLLYHTDTFKQYVNSVIPDKLHSCDEHARLIIPFFNEHGMCTAFQGRAYGDEQPKYLTVKIKDEADRIYGLERINYSKRIYITEGPLDSLFLPNALAVSGSSFDSPTVAVLKTNATLVYDNEPRSPDITKLIRRSIDAGYSVCLWPDTVEQKDINEMILAGRSPDELLEIINQNTYQGAAASMRFVSWCKCKETK